MDSIHTIETSEGKKVKMGVPHVTSFCWCLGLEMGAKVVGVVHLLVSFTLMVVCLLFAEGTKQYIGTVEDAEDHIYSTWYKIAVSVAVASVVHVALAATLLLSAFRRWVLGLRIWVWVMLVLFVCALVFDVVLVALYGLSGSGSDIFLSFLEAVLFFGALAYCILCVNSYYLMLKSVEDMEGPHKSDY